MRKRASPLAGILAWAVVIGVVLGTLTAGGSALAQGREDCTVYLYRYESGKTVEGFHARATDGCRVADWTGSIGQGPGQGRVTFRTTGNNLYLWQGSGLPSPAGGDQNACTSRAVQEANAYFTNLFQAPAGTEVTVAYRCD